MSLLLRVEDLKTQFTTERGLVRAVDGVSYDIEEGEIIGLVGESGCGKSVSQLSIMRLIPSPPGEIVGGRVMFEGQDLLGFEANSAEMRAIRGGKIAMIFQEPMTSLNPALTIARQLTEVMQLHLNMDGAAARERSVELLGLVGIPDGERRIDDYPHQFSGGMRQRVMVAMAVSCNPRLIIADEPTTALDATIQAQLLEAHEGHSGPLQHVNGHGHPQSRNRGPLCPPHQCHVCRAHRGVGYGEGDMGQSAPSVYHRPPSVCAQAGKQADAHKRLSPSPDQHGSYVSLSAAMRLSQGQLRDRRLEPTEARGGTPLCRVSR